VSVHSFQALGRGLELALTPQLIFTHARVGHALIPYTVTPAVYGTPLHRNKPDQGSLPISPVIAISNTNSALVFSATKCTSGVTTCDITMYELTPTALNVISIPLSLQTGSGSTLQTYETANTPVVDQAHSRIYVMASQTSSQSQGPKQGRLFAIDFGANPSGADPINGLAYGQTSVSTSWYVNFPGPSGSSPLVIPSFTSAVTGHTGTAIFFDGQAYSSAGSGGAGAGSGNPCSSETSSTSQPTLDLNTSDTQYGCFFGVLDSQYSSSGSSSAEVMWGRAFLGETFAASAVYDDHNGDIGFWIFPLVIQPLINGPTCQQPGQNNGLSPPNCLIRIKASNGLGNSTNNQLQGPLDIGILLGKSITCGDNINGCPTIGVAAGTAGAYGPSSAITLTQGSVSGHIHIFLTLGAFSNASGACPYVVNIDVTNTNSEALNWYMQLATIGQCLAPTEGQFPTVLDSSGNENTVFTGTTYGPAFIH